jgi:hypothetical protein
MVVFSGDSAMISGLRELPMAGGLMAGAMLAGRYVELYGLNTHTHTHTHTHTRLLSASMIVLLPTPPASRSRSLLNPLSLARKTTFLDHGRLCASYHFMWSPLPTQGERACSERVCVVVNMWALWMCVLVRGGGRGGGGHAWSGVV